MLDAYLKSLDQINRTKHPVARVFQLDGLVRASLQAAALGALQVAAKLRDRSDDAQVEELFRLLDSVLEQEARPSDRAFLNIVERLRARVGEKLTPDQCDRLGRASNLAKEWIDGRNRRAHRFVSEECATRDWGAFGERQARELFEHLAPLIPTQSTDSKAYIHLQDMPIFAEICPPVGVLIGCDPRANEWILRYQIVDTQNTRPFELRVSSDIALFNLREHFSERMQRRGEVIFFVREPPPDFVARMGDLIELRDWFDSGEPVCVLTGIGGLGKTALALQFVKGLIDRPPQRRSLRLIVFLSAKTSEWTISGMRRLDSAITRVDAIVRTLCKRIQLAFRSNHGVGKLEECSGVELLELLESLLKKVGLKSSDMLLVLDNAETITADEGGALLTTFRRLASLVRVLVTTRDGKRWDSVSARRHELQRLDSKDIAHILDNRARAMRVDQIYQLGHKRLLKEAEAAGGLPIIADALVRLCKDEKISFDEALKRLHETRIAASLANFLYDSAWAKLDNQLRDVLIAMSRFGLPITEAHLHIICRKIGYSLERWRCDSTAAYFLFDRHDGHVWELDPPAHTYLDDRYSALPAQTRSTLDEVRKELDAVKELDIILTDGDRVAYRTGLAWEAHAMVLCNELTKAVSQFEEALRFDRGNGYLRVRFAEVLLLTGSLDRAREVLLEASTSREGYVDLGELHWTMASLELRCDRQDQALSEVANAESRGYPSSSCVLRRREITASGFSSLRSTGSPMAALQSRDEKTTRSVRDSVRTRLESLKKIRPLIWQMVADATVTADSAKRAGRQEELELELDGDASLSDAFGSGDAPLVSDDLSADLLEQESSLPFSINEVDECIRDAEQDLQDLEDRLEEMNADNSTFS